MSNLDCLDTADVTDAPDDTTVGLSITVGSATVTAECFDEVTVLAADALRLVDFVLGDALTDFDRFGETDFLRGLTAFLQVVLGGARGLDSRFAGGF